MVLLWRLILILVWSIYPLLVSTDCPWSRAALKSHGEVLSRNLFELRDGSAQRVLRRLAVAFSSGNSRRSGALGLQGTAQDPSLARGAGETAGLPPAQQAMQSWMCKTSWFCDASQWLFQAGIRGDRARWGC
jgi:hypothetical protein